MMEPEQLQSFPVCGCALLLRLCVVLSAPESFCYKRFFQLCGLSSKTPKEIQDVFHILDDDDSGYIEESELKCVKQCCRVNHTCQRYSSGNSQRWTFCLIVCAGTSYSGSSRGREH